MVPEVVDFDNLCGLASQLSKIVPAVVDFDNPPTLRVNVLEPSWGEVYFPLPPPLAFFGFIL